MLIQNIRSRVKLRVFFLVLVGRSTNGGTAMVHRAQALFLSVQNQTMERLQHLVANGKLHEPKQHIEYSVLVEIIEIPQIQVPL